MASKKVTEFFKNKVSIRLKTGQQFRGLLCRIDNKNGIVVLEDIQDLGNAYDKEQLPHDKKIAEKIFEAENIQEIILNDKIFADPKKYNPDDFFDSMTEHKDKFREKGEDRQNRDSRPRGNYKGGRGGRGGSNNYQQKDRRDDRREDKRDERPKKNYESKQERRGGNQDDDRDYR